MCKNGSPGPRALVATPTRWAHGPGTQSRGESPQPQSSRAESAWGSDAQESGQRHLLGSSIGRPDPETCDLTLAQHKPVVRPEYAGPRNGDPHGRGGPDNQSAAAVRGREDARPQTMTRCRPLRAESHMVVGHGGQVRDKTTEDTEQKWPLRPTCVCHPGHPQAAFTWPCSALKAGCRPTPKPPTLAVRCE